MSFDNELAQRNDAIAENQHAYNRETRRAAEKDLPKAELDIEEFEQIALEAQNSVPGLKLRMKNGESFTIPHPMLVGDDTQRQIERVQNEDDLDKYTLQDVVDDRNRRRDAGIEEPSDVIAEGFTKEPKTINGQPARGFNVRFAEAILSPEVYARFSAAGGNANHVVLAWQYLADRMQTGPKQ